MRILCTNDDGYSALGIEVLASAARALGSVTIVAPDREQSATSNSLTLHHPLRVHRAKDGALVVDGTPTDCVILAVNELMDERPDLCFSGINHGSNMGEDVLYSGTVAGAMEATVIGIPAIAVSYTGDAFEDLSAWGGDRYLCAARDRRTRPLSGRHTFQRQPPPDRSGSGQRNTHHLARKTAIQRQLDQGDRSIRARVLLARRGRGQLDGGGGFRLCRDPRRVRLGSPRFT